VFEVQCEHAVDQRVDQRVQRAGGLRVAVGELGLAHARLEHEFQRQGAQRFGHLGEAAAEHAHQVEQIVVGDPCVTCDVSHPRGLQLGFGVHGVVLLGDRQSHRSARRDQKALLDSAHLGHFTRGVALAADDHAVGRQVHDRARGGAAAQLGQRHAVVGELLQQRQALCPLRAVDPVEQALCGEVDPLGAHLTRSVRQAGVRWRAQNHRP
jgi:hypothetical protein